MDWITLPLCWAIVFGFIYKIVELFVRKRERLMLVNKITELSGVDFHGISLYRRNGKFTTLRIGWMLMGIGMGFLVGFLINLMATYGRYAYDFNSMYPYHDNVAGVVYVACICIFGGCGLLVAYRMERKAEHPEEKKDEFGI